MEFLDEAHLGFHRIEALVERDQVRASLLQGGVEERIGAAAWLAFLGWTPTAFLAEAYPEGWVS